MTEFAVILPAAGKSERFGGRDKLLEELAGASVLQWAVEAFVVRQDVGEIIIATRDEQKLRGIQTPQIGKRVDFLEAIEKCPLGLDELTDDAQLLELAGKDVWMVEGEERNIKITTPQDLQLADLMLRSGR